MASFASSSFNTDSFNEGSYFFDVVTVTILTPKVAEDGSVSGSEIITRSKIVPKSRTDYDKIAQQLITEDEEILSICVSSLLLGII